jgi:phosphate acyltransferase
VMAFENALSRAYEAANHNLLERVKSRILHAAPLLNRNQTAVSP